MLIQDYNVFKGQSFLHNSVLIYVNDNWRIKSKYLNKSVI